MRYKEGDNSSLSLNIFLVLTNRLFMTTRWHRYLLTLFLETRKLRHRELKQLALGHTARKWQNWDLNPGCLWLVWFHIPVLPHTLHYGVGERRLEQITVVATGIKNLIPWDSSCGCLGFSLFYSWTINHSCPSFPSRSLPPWQPLIVQGNAMQRKGHGLGGREIWI